MAPAERDEKELVFALFLPPLVFEAAFALPWPELRRDLAPTIALATVGVLVSTAVVFLGFSTIVQGMTMKRALKGFAETA